MTVPHYRADIDGLRAVAVLAVVMHHLSASLVPGGYVGVDVFFVISGYLITSIISREMAQGRFSFARFYERRARRIFPALFAVLAASLVAGYFLLLPSDYEATLRGTLGTLFFASNFVFWRDTGYFAATDAMINPLLHTWSLAVEEQFYVFFPVLLMLCFRCFRRHIVPIIIMCTVASLVVATLLVKSKGAAVFFLSPFRAWELLAGALLAFNVVPVIHTRALRELTSCVGLLAIAAACFVYDEMTTFPGLTALAPVLGAVAIIQAGASGPNLVGRFLQWRPVVYVGLISYSLYLWHWPLIVLTRYAIGMEPLTPYIPVLFVASLALASLSYHFIEKPFRHGVHMSRRFLFLSSAVFVSALSLTSVVGLMMDGFVERFTSEVVQLDKMRSSQIPFGSCDQRPAGEWCTLGRSDIKPTMLLWGDSHLLAWAPALDKSLASQNKRALFAPASGCPPLLDVDIGYMATCSLKNLAVKSYLLAHTEINTVLMSARWGASFSKDSPLKASANQAPAKGSAAAGNALASTIQWLRDNKNQVVLIGPVPVYEKSVPLALALEKKMGLKFIPSSMEAQQLKHASFLQVIDDAKRQGDASFRYLDPIKWMCADNCVVMKDGVALYRDANHLSVAGAMELEADVRRGLTGVSVGLGSVGSVATAPAL